MLLKDNKLTIVTVPGHVTQHTLTAPGPNGYYVAIACRIRTFEAGLQCEVNVMHTSRETLVFTHTACNHAGCCCISGASL